MEKEKRREYLSLQEIRKLEQERQQFEMSEHLAKLIAPVTCNICSMEIDRDNLVTLKCKHSFCFLCCNNTFAIAIENGKSDLNVFSSFY